MTARGLLFAVLLLAGGCAEEQSKFAVVFTVATDDGRPLADIPMTLGKVPLGKTDAQGRLQKQVAGKEGQRIGVSIEVPKGYRPPAKPLEVVLRQLKGIEGGGRALPVELGVKLSPLKRKYAVMVRAGVGGLGVETFGTRQAVTSDKGVALFLYEGAPGDELQVRLDTSSKPDLRPQSPTQSFLLASRPEAYIVKQTFASVAPPPPPPPKKKRHVGPKRL
jgi:hypothetical protein